MKISLLQTNNNKEIGYVTWWKDRTKGKLKEFSRPVIRTSRGMEEAGIVIARAFYPDIDLTGKKIFYLDGDKTNLSPDNICIVPATIFNQLLNNKLLSDDRKLNKAAVLTLMLGEKAKHRREVSQDE